MVNEDEKRGYSKGYAAGKRHKRNAIRIKRDAFWQRAFLAALPVAFAADGWKRGDTPINDLDDRVKLAAEVADEAMKQAVMHL